MGETNDTKVLAERLTVLGAKPLSASAAAAKAAGEAPVGEGPAEGKAAQADPKADEKSAKTGKKAAKAEKSAKADPKSAKTGKKAAKAEKSAKGNKKGAKAVKAAKGDKKGAGKAEKKSAVKAGKGKAGRKKAPFASAVVIPETSAFMPLPEAGYPNLVLCVVDAVFVQRGRLAATEQVCALVTYGASQGWRPAAYAAKFTPLELVTRLKDVADTKLAGDVFGSDTKALGCPDLTRARVVVELCRGLADAGVLTKADARDPENRAAISAVVKATRGFGAAGEARLMQLAAEFDATGAPWLADYFSEVLGRTVATTETDSLLEAAALRLTKGTPGLTSRDAAFAIWRAAAGYSPTFRCL